MKGLTERIKAALDKDPKILVRVEEMEDTEGFELSYLESLGIRKTDLKTLERAGMAIRAYLETPQGNKTRWFLFVGA